MNTHFKKYPTTYSTFVWSGKRDSNPRRSAWKADALPTELFPLWWRGEDLNLRSLRQQIYSLPPLATREPLHVLEPAMGLEPATC
jgi:hypothetical protein